MTDTTEKENLHKEQETLSKKKAKGVNKKSKATKRVEKVKKAILHEVNSDSSSGDECFCLICWEKYSDRQTVFHAKVGFNAIFANNGPMKNVSQTEVAFTLFVLM